MNHEELEMAPGQALQVAKIVSPKASPEPALDVLDMDQVLTYTQNKRLRAINEINKRLGELEDPTMFSVLFKGLGDMDKAVVQRRRVGIEEESAKNADEQARDHAALLRSITAKAFQVPLGEGISRPAPSLDDTHGTAELVPGETDQGTHEMSYDAFAKDIDAQT